MDSSAPQPSGFAGSRVVEFDVTGMTCGSCVARIEQTLAGQDGVEQAAVDLTSNRATVTLAPRASIKAITGAVQAMGYTMSTATPTHTG